MWIGFSHFAPLHFTSYILEINRKKERQWHYNLFMIRFGALNRRRLRRYRLQLIQHTSTMEKCDSKWKEILLLRLFLDKMDGRKMRWMWSSLGKLGKINGQKENCKSVKDLQSIYLHYFLWHKCVFIIQWGKFITKN